MWNQARIRGFAVIFIALMVNSPVLAQTASTGAIRGTIVDPTGASMSGVVVEAVSSATGTERKSVSEASGIYTVGLLPPGLYQLRFLATGFELPRLLP
jgi:hypothetical protein